MTLLVLKFRGLTKTINQSLLVNAGYLLGINLLPGLLGLVFWGICTRFYITEDVGLASAVISVITLVSSISGLGTQYGLIRYLPESDNRVNFVNSVITLNLITACIAGFVFLAGASIWTPSIAIIRNNWFFTSVFFVFLISSTVGTVVVYTFVARLSSKYAFLYTIAVNIVRLLILALSIHLGAVGIVGANAWAIFLALLFMSILFLPKSINNYSFKIAWDWSLYKLIIPYSLGNYLVALLAQFPQTFLPLIILQELGSKANAYAYIPLLLISMITSIGFSLATSAFAEGSNDFSRSETFVKRAAFIGISISIVIALIVTIGAPWLLWFFGDKFVDQSSSLLRWGAFAGIFMVFNQMVYTELRIKKMVISLMVLSLTSLVATIITTYFLIPKFGISSAGIGLLIGNVIVSFIVAIHFLFKRFRHS